jgi:glutamate racemase
VSVLVFDSGVGGLSVLDSIRARLPGLAVTYAADDAGFPYGEKSEAEIAARVPALLGRLVERYRPRLVVIACNTASTIALGPARAALGVPVVGTVPAIKPAAAATATGVIGVLGTAATVRQPYVDALAADHARGMTLLRHGAPALVRAAEARLRGDARAGFAESADALAALRAMPGGDRLDTLVLACTHFPLLADALAEAAGPGVRLIDSGDGIARRVATLLADDWPRGPGRAVFTRGDDAAALAPALAGRGLDRVETL